MEPLSGISATIPILVKTDLPFTGRLVNGPGTPTAALNSSQPADFHTDKVDQVLYSV